MSETTNPANPPADRPFHGILVNVALAIDFDTIIGATSSDSSMTDEDFIQNVLLNPELDIVNGGYDAHIKSALETVLKSLTLTSDKPEVTQFQIDLMALAALEPQVWDIDIQHEDHRECWETARGIIRDGEPDPYAGGDPLDQLLQILGEQAAALDGPPVQIVGAADFLADLDLTDPESAAG